MTHRGHWGAARASPAPRGRGARSSRFGRHPPDLTTLAGTRSAAPSELRPHHFRLPRSPGGLLPHVPMPSPAYRTLAIGFRVPLNAEQFHLEIPH